MRLWRAQPTRSIGRRAHDVRAADYEPSKERLILNQLGITGSLLLSQIVNFVLLMVILRLVLYGPVMKMLDQRKERIAQSMKDAERVSGRPGTRRSRRRRKIIDEARREAQEIRAQATRDAEKNRAGGALPRRGRCD